MEHALLSPSSSNRWLICTRSARLEEKIPQKSSQWADEGNLAHDYCANGLRYLLGKISESQFRINWQQTALTARQADFNFDEIKFYGDQYITYCHARANAIKGSKAFVEERYDLSAYVPGGFGTSDFTIVSLNKLTVIDYKYGQGVQVEAKENSQLMLYALGMLELALLYYPIKHVEMIIYQPRLDNVSSYTITVKELLDWAEKTVKPQAQLAWDGAGVYKAGKHCKFCAVKARCKALAKYSTELAQYDFQLPDTLTFDQIGKILSKADVFINWIQAVKDYALDQAKQGASIPGFKMVRGRSNRAWIDEKKTLDHLLKAGYTRSEVMDIKLKTISELEKVLGKGEFHSILSKFVIKPNGAPALVPLNDKRAAIQSAEDAANDFKHLKL